MDGSGTPDRDTILQKVKDIIAHQLTIDTSEITEESSFVDDLGADSLDQVELIMEFEDAFGIEITDGEAEGISTVGQAVMAIEERLRAKKT